MAYLENRGDSIRVCWRLGGGSGKKQSASFTGADPRAVKTLAERAKKLVEAHGERITREEVLRQVLELPDPALSGVPLLRDWAQRWLDARAPLDPDRPGVDEIQADTLADYASILKARVLPYLGHRYVTEVTEDAVKQWVKALRASRVGRCRSNPGGRPISANSVRRAHSILHQVLGAAVPKYLDRNPAARPEGTRKNRVGLPKAAPFEGMYLQPWEHERIHDCCPEQIADLWYVLVRTGLRLGEAIVLRPADVTIEGGRPEIRVRRALKANGQIGAPKSAKSRRVVTISSAVAEVLARRCEGVRAHGLLFPSPAGMLWCENNLRQRFFLPAVAQAMRCADHPPPAPAKPRSGPTRRLRLDEVSTCGCPGVLRRRPRIHDARHTHASNCIVVAKMLPIEVQHRLGHSTVTTTMNVYSHLWQGVERERLDAMEGQARAADQGGGDDDLDDESA